MIQKSSEQPPFRLNVWANYPVVPWHYQETPAVAARRAAWLEKKMQARPSTFDPKRDIPWNPKWLYKHGEDPARRELFFASLAHAFAILASN